MERETTAPKGNPGRWVVKVVKASYVLYLRGIRFRQEGSDGKTWSVNLRKYVVLCYLSVSQVYNTNVVI